MKRLNSILFRSIFSAGVILGTLTLPRALQAQWRATVGAQSKNGGHQALAFLPNEIWIHAGDDITWKFVTDEITTVKGSTSPRSPGPCPVGCPGFSPQAH